MFIKKKIFFSNSGQGDRNKLIYGTFASITIKIISVSLSFFTAIILARILGPGGYGDYAYVFALVSILIIPIQFGLPDLIIRETARAKQLDRWATTRGLWRWSNALVVLMSIVLITIVLGLESFIKNQIPNLNIDTLYWGLLLIPFIAFTRVSGAKLQGLQKVIKGQVPDSVLRPGLFMLSLLAMYSFYYENSMTAKHAMSLHFICASLAFLAGLVFVRVNKPDQLKNTLEVEYDTKKWISSILPLAFISGMSVVNTETDLIMIGVFLSPEDVGIYRVATQGSLLVSFGLTAIGMVVMPYFAKYYASNEMDKFQRLATFGARAMLLMAVPVAIFFFVYGGQLLSYVFGEEYKTAYVPLVILSFAHIIHAGFGIVGPLLNMTGNEKLTAKGISIAAICNILLNIILIPIYGVPGAAVATASSLILWNIILWVAVWKTINIDSSILGKKYKA